MSKVQFTLVSNEDGSGIIVYVPGSKPMVADDSHPNFNRIVDGAKSGDASVVALFDVAETASEKFSYLSDRVSIKGGVVYLDGDPINDTIASQIVRFVDEGIDDWMPLVNFFEHVQANPNEHSREQLYTWLAQEDFTITQDGYIVGYKGVALDGNGGYRSISSGRAIVDGEVHNGQIPNHVGAIVEMPRSEVHHDPTRGCSVGLHVGTWDYASGFAQGATLEVHVNPRDVVSVPTDSNWAKMRVCRYIVVDAVEQPYASPVIFGNEENEEDYEGWGEREYDEDRLCEGCGTELYSDEDELCVYCEEADDPGVIVSPGVVIGDIFRDRDSRRDGRTLTVEMIDEYNGVAKCRSSSSGKLVDVSIDRLLSRKYEKVN